MIRLSPLTLEGHGVRLEPLTLVHTDSFETAIADGKLWELWYTAVPEPGKVDVDIEALGAKKDGALRLARR